MLLALLLHVVVVIVAAVMLHINVLWKIMCETLQTFTYNVQHKRGNEMYHVYAVADNANIAEPNMTYIRYVCYVYVFYVFYMYFMLGGFTTQQKNMLMHT